MKKVLCIVLSVILSCSVTISAFAVNNECTCEQTPLVYVDGFASCSLMINPGEADSASALSFDKDTIINIVKNLVKIKNTKTLADAIIKIGNDFCEYIKCDENGDSKYNVGRVCVVNEAQDHKTNFIYHFYYDWRLDPYTLADRLNTYIENVKSATHHSKVNLCGYSEGGAVINTYLSKYGYGSLETFSMIYSAYQGITMVGELLQRKAYINAEGIFKFVENFLPADGNLGILREALSELDNSGLTGKLGTALNKVFVEYGDKIYDEFLIPVFGQWAALWDFAPDKYYESGKLNMLKDTEKYSKFIEKLDKYHYTVQKNANKNILDAHNHGVKIAIVSGYNFPEVPVFRESLQYQSDSLIDTKFTSAGATCLPYGEKFLDDYENINSKYISPDRMIDASTCLFLEYTWFVKNASHYSDDYVRQVMYNVYNSDEQLTVDTNPGYPQFLIYKDKKGIVPLTAESDTEQHKGILNLIIDAINKLITIIKSMFVK